MIKLNYQNLIALNQSNPKLGISQAKFDQQVSQFNSYQAKLNTRQQGFVDLPYQNIQPILEYIKLVKNKYETVLLLGIGGSMLGPKAIIETLGIQNSIQIKFLDNIDPYLIEQTVNHLTLSKTLILVQTKSGSTPETMAEYYFFRELLEKAELPVQNHMVFVTDPEKGILRQIAREDKIPSFELPSNVGGRFSVLSPIGLLLAGLAGLDIASLVAGAREIQEKQVSAAYELAILQHQASLSGQTIQVIMSYSSRLKTFTEWCIQLYSESLGKKLDLDGKIVHTGLTPLPAIGATDQHSQLQLFMEGPNDKLLNFIEITDHQADPKIPSIQNPQLSYLSNLAFSDLLKAELTGVKQALTEASRPNLSLQIPKINEYYLGSLFQFFELTVAYLGELMNIDAFDQPGVERSKILTKKTLLEG